MGLLSLSLLLVTARQFTYHKTHLFKVIHSKVFFFFIRTLKNYLFVFGCTRSSLLQGLFPCSQQGLPSGCSAQAYHCSSFFTSGAPTLGHWASVVEAHGLQGAGSVTVAQGFCCPEACGIFPDKGWNRCLLLCKADS